MLGKLIKYEFQATGRILLPLYGALIVMALVTNVLLVTEADFISGISVTVFVGLCVASAVMTLLLVIQRFRNNLLSDEGYLMFTLPTTTGRLIWSKLIVSLCWMLLGPLVGLISGVLLFIDGDMLVALPDLFRIYIPDFMDSLTGSFWLFIVGSLLQIAIFFLAVYLSLAVAQLPPFAPHRRLFALLTFFVLYIIFFSILCDVMPGILLLPVAVTSMPNDIVWTLLCQLVLCALLFGATWYILRYKLNLE